MDQVGTEKKVVVVGAGFSGLVTSYYLLRAGFKVEILESKDRPGGLIHTYKTEHGNVETAASGLLNCEELESLCHEIGVELIATKPDARKRYIFRNGEPQRWPLKIIETVKLLRFLFLYLFFKKWVAPHDNETVSKWGARVFGASASQYSIETAVLGVYGADARTLSASIVLKRLFSREPSPRSQLNAGRGTVSPKGGMSDLIEGLSSYLQVNGVKLAYGKEVFSMSDIPDCDWIVVATSVGCATELLKALEDGRYQLLERVSMLPVTSTTVFTKPLSRARIEGFGVLFPEVDNHLALGVLFNHHIFANRVALGLQGDTWITPGAEMRDQFLIDSILSERQKVLKQKVELLDYKVNRWPKGLPHYNTEHEEVLRHLRPVEGRVALIGNYLGEIGLKQILLRAKWLSEELLRKSQ